MMQHSRESLAERLRRHPFILFLMPGVSLKRWLLAAAAGLFIVAFGVLFALDIPTAGQVIPALSVITLDASPPWLRGMVFIGLGLLAAGAAGYGLQRSVRRVERRPGHSNILEAMYVNRVLGAGPRIAVIGGGSGLPSLIRGIKPYSSNITAIVTMADDGGSSGRLRKELGIQPPGDIRNCLVALADSEAVMQQLMDYRFSSAGELDGHNFGNMLIAALVGIGGDFYRGVESAGQLLAIRGKVVPSTATDVTLVGNTVEGETLVGETTVARANGRLRTLQLQPANPPAHPEALLALEEADMVIIGPGSLYTSIVPNLLIGQLARAVARSPALKIYVCNVAEEPHQTEGYGVKEHLEVVRQHLALRAVDVVVANSNIPAGPTPAGLDFIRARPGWNDAALLVEADVIDEVHRARHHSGKLAEVIAGIYRRHRGKRRRLPWAIKN